MKLESNINVALLITLDSKCQEALLVAEMLVVAGVRPWIVDLSLRPHQNKGASVSGGQVAEAAGSTWEEMERQNRSRAAETMITGGRKILLDRFRSGELSGVIGVGGANGSYMACALMREMPPTFPKVMVSPVAATAAVQWYVGESDIVMFPSIGDISVNRIVNTILKNAAFSVAAMSRIWSEKINTRVRESPLIGVSSFGGTAGCVNRIVGRLEALNYEVILFHASGPGGRALESLVQRGELAGVIDVTTHELADLHVDGVYSAGDGRLRSAGEASLPQVVVPGALDHSNFWAGMVPERFRNRSFIQYNAQNILMRTNAEEFEALGREVANRLNEAKGPVAVLIPTLGFSEHTNRTLQNLDGREVGLWDQPETDAVFVKSLRKHLTQGRVEEFHLHINDPKFADICVNTFLEML